MKLSRRDLLKAASVTGVGAALGVPAFLRHASAADPIKIGLPAALSGSNAQYGIQAKRACELFGKEINAKGGVHRPAPRVHLRGHRRRSRHRRAQGAEAGREGRRQDPHRHRALVRGAGRLREVPGVEGHPHVDHQRRGLAHHQGLEPLLLPHQHERAHGRARGQPLPGRGAHEALLRPGQRLRVGPRQRGRLREADQAPRRRRSSARTIRPLGTKDFASYICKIKQAKADGAATSVLPGQDSSIFLRQAGQFGLNRETKLDHGDPGAREHEGGGRGAWRAPSAAPATLHGGHAEEQGVREALPRACTTSTPTCSTARRTKAWSGCPGHAEGQEPTTPSGSSRRGRIPRTRGWRASSSCASATTRPCSPASWWRRSRTRRIRT